MILRRIEALCADRGISIGRLEKELGFGNATIRYWGGSSPKVENIKRVADYFGMTIDELIKEEACDENL